MSTNDSVQRVKAYIAARVPGGQNSDHIHGMNGNTPLLVSDLKALVEVLEQPGRVLKKREEDLLKVFPILWDNIFGGFIFAIDQAHGTLESDPKSARHILEGLREDLQNMREFMMYGDKESTAPAADTTKQQ